MTAKTEMKTCSKCESEFPATTEHFFKHRVNKYGDVLLKGRCKQCCRLPMEKEREKSKLYYEKNKEKICKQKKLKRDIKKGITI